MRPIDLGAWALALVAATLFLSPSLSVLPLVALLWALWLERRIGGVSGDGHGAGIEISETALLIAAIVWTLFR